MASLQTNTVLSSPNAANAGIKASLPPASGGTDDFAAMLSGANSAAPQKNDARPKSVSAEAQSSAQQPHVKQGAKADAKADAKPASKTDAKSGRKSADKPDDTANAKAETAKPTVAAQQQQVADASDDDAANDSAGSASQAAANQNSADAGSQPNADAPQAAPPPDAAAQAQQMLAAATPAAPQPPVAQAQQALAAAAAGPANDNSNVPANAVAGNNASNNATGPAAKTARAPVPRASAAPATSAAADPGAATDTSAAASTAKPAAGNAQDFLKAITGHQDNKDQAVAQAGAQASAQTDTKSDATQAVADSTPPPAPTPAPQAAAPTNIAAGTPGVTGIAANNGVANGAVAANVHVAPQAANVTPNVNGLAVEIAARSQSGAKEFQIRLDPPELGHVEVRLSIDASGKAEAHMSADQQQTLDLLQKNSPALTSALRDAGLDVSQSGLNFSLKGQDRQSEGGNNGAQARGATQNLTATRTIDAVQSANPYLSSAGDARLDIHV